MAEWKRVENIGDNNDVYIKAGDIREIVEIKAPSDVCDEFGEKQHKAAIIVVKGPKGGKLNISLPEQYWQNIEAAVMSDRLKPGMGVDCIGWKKLFDSDGNPVMDDNGRQRTTFYPDGQRPRYYSK